MIQAYKEYWRNITLMDAKATRSQYWWPQLANYLVLAIYGWATHIETYYDSVTESFTKMSLPAVGFAILTCLIWLANFTIRARRLHDTNRSNWWILLYLLPIIGPVILFIFFVMPSKPYSRWRWNQSDV
ncbi:uncharacterized membrane protein YhaH (DUF805 family) [Enterococcus sp. PF1-24]|uniref:DUF805 domain-containing protein n=1 Tax=unclassified Enterococcus TaxID=2608891 RepID=UPI00247467B9|nr:MULTISPECIES: DUF805 domain-containing protein [unclassified Enterococcus]MDH6365779.1 uncharacterized membrane protein YhaH (DUF805 family) [Enterococcus sp. PFB1-1]MDH6402888.1 uncharacterized membrane protein YhaH (DUF805 family) [Enterococcus sp. PF1-24]